MWPETERTLHAYDNDPVLSGDLGLASRIIERSKARPASTGWSAVRRIEFGMAAVIVMLLLNIITVIYVSGGFHRNVIRQDVITQLSSEYDIDQSQNNEVR
ncbi:MAG: hypothetical protein ACOYNS_13705 [Bacteroidota bacterium]